MFERLRGLPPHPLIVEFNMRYASPQEDESVAALGCRRAENEGQS